MKVDFSKLDRAFNPECVVVVGDKVETDLRWLRAQSAFKGKLYSVQISPESIQAIEALGVKNFTSLLDIADPIDLVIVAVPRSIAPKILDDCIRKEVAAAHFFTAGFSETDTEEGRNLEKLLVSKAREANFHLIGPNCMGIFNPKVGIKQGDAQYDGVSGPVGFISQSGNHAVTFATEAHFQGVDINKSVSFGNGVVLDAPDFLEYLGSDDENKVIAMYLEGLKDGRRFLKVLKEVSARKPVVIWKGGRTGVGGRAIASHTGSLAISRVIWDAAMKQCGGVTVANVEELIDTVQALIHLSPVHGNRVGVTGGSGGQSVAVADAFAEAGLDIPLLTKESYAELASFWTLIGGGYPNPIDTGNENRKELKRILEILERDSNIDNVVMILMLAAGFKTEEDIENEIRLIVSTRKRTSKPVMVITPATRLQKTELVREVRKKLQDGDVPAFVSLERGARALRNAVEYYQLKDAIKSEA